MSSHQFAELSLVPWQQLTQNKYRYTDLRQEGAEALQAFHNRACLL